MNLSYVVGQYCLASLVNEAGSESDDGDDAKDSDSMGSEYNAVILGKCRSMKFLEIYHRLEVAVFYLKRVGESAQRRSFYGGCVVLRFATSFLLTAPLLHQLSSPLHRSRCCSCFACGSLHCPLHLSLSSTSLLLYSTYVIHLAYRLRTPLHHL
jgi:hypothetical protein